MFATFIKPLKFQFFVDTAQNLRFLAIKLGLLPKIDGLLLPMLGLEPEMLLVAPPIALGGASLFSS